LPQQCSPRPERSLGPLALAIAALDTATVVAFLSGRPGGRPRPARPDVGSDHVPQIVELR
jgi:hypothetical protein